MIRLISWPALVVILAGISNALHVGKVPQAIPVMRDALGISMLQAGFMLSSLQLAGMIGGIWVGALAGSIGLRRSILIGLTTLALSSVLGGITENISMLLLSRVGESFGFLLVALSAPALINQLVPPNRINIFLGLWSATMPAGTALGLLFGATTLNIIGWNGLWFSVGIISAAMAIWIVIIVPSDPARTGQNAVRNVEHLRASLSQLKQTLKTRVPWLVAITFALYSSQWLAIIGFLPFIYIQQGYLATTAGSLTALVATANIVGNIAASRFLHWGISAPSLLQTAFAGASICTFMAFSEINETRPALRYIFVLFFSAIGGMIPGVLFSLCVKMAPSKESIPSTIGWALQFSAAGQFFGPPLFAIMIKETGDWNWIWIITGAASFFGIISAQAIRSEIKRR
jgi:MFS transporter, CP family, cyanate transporter